MLPGRLAAFLMRIIFGLWLSMLPAGAQDVPQEAPRAATGGAQTLEEILARQNALREGGLPGGQLTLEPREARPPVPTPPITGPLGPRGDVELSDMWNRLRGGDPLVLIKPAPSDAVMTTTGQQWRLIRERLIRPYLGWLPVGVLALLAVWHLIRGPMRLKEGRSGRTVPRFSIAARVAHWYMAGVFILLALTGLVILLGRVLIAPWLGLEVNSVLASASMQGHNLFGPLFIVALLWMFLGYVRHNFFQWVDLKWILKLGGLFGGHASSGKFNFGEKTWFWMVVFFGTIIAATGVLMLFPWLTGDVRLLQLATVLHAVSAVILIAVALGHIYVGTIGMEGAIDGMITGEADENWAREHHDLWYERVAGEAAANGDKEKAK
ncbi:MAG TPA: formate dehydrogenase subunit gamma [Aliiroseovarius sp.]|nr:formate dehydrogenase subunit gamma [Aliiroseovarius sp.]